MTAGPTFKVSFRRTERVGGVDVTNAIDTGAARVIRDIFAEIRRRGLIDREPDLPLPTGVSTQVLDELGFELCGERENPDL